MLYLQFVFPHGLRLNTEAYIKYLTEVVLIWIGRVAAGRPTSSSRILYHATEAVEPSSLSGNSWDHITPNIGPPNFPDCNPLDHHVWGSVKQMNDKTSRNIKDKLKISIMTAFTNLSKDNFGKACKNLNSSGFYLFINFFCIDLLHEFVWTRKKRKQIKKQNDEHANKKKWRKSKGEISTTRVSVEINKN